MVKRRFAKEDWILLGLDLLKQDGPSAMTVERLCTEADRTRGSFYHHFEDHDAFLLAIASFWKENHTLNVFAHLDRQNQGQDRLDALNEQVTQLDLQLEISIRQLAARLNGVAEIVESVDQLRLDYLERIYLSFEQPFPISAREIAELDYAAFLGAILLWPHAPIERQIQRAGIVQRLLKL